MAAGSGEDSEAVGIAAGLLTHVTIIEIYSI